MQRRYPDRTLRPNGLTWRIRDSGGNGTPLLLFPGGLGNADIYYNQMLDLTPDIRCICVDYPDTDFDVTADSLAALLDALALDRACMLGSSLAGYCLQVFGARHPERVDAMILANSFYNSTELSAHPLFDRSLLESVSGEELKTDWLNRLEMREADELREVQITILREGQTGELLRRRLLAAATAPEAPIILHGLFPLFIIDCADDPLLPAATRNALAERYPDAPRFTLPSGGHYPSVTQSHVYNRVILKAVPHGLA
ncbi:Putative aminoacrylate hydrolase RutD [Sphingobium sp. CECT 9361]|nr:alpha/beta hydrolase [Sphingobium sp. CECT 9361]CAH0357041.1 Putative aminoacrylate hydrolase RutD [Sphingobium sp. CECT 9361]